MAGLRSIVADTIQTALGDGYTVYATGVPVVKTPAVVINPSDPYQVPTTMGVDASTAYALELWLVTNRTSPTDAMDHLESMREVVTDAIKAGAPAGRWTSFGRFGVTSVGDKQYATAVVECLFTAADKLKET